MSKVVPLEQSCGYLVERAQKHSLAGHYDEAMALLTKAQGQYGPQDEIEYELGGVYEEMDCDEEATRAYLRVVRLRGAHQPEALFRLALLAAARSDAHRALSYFERFTDAGMGGVSEEDARAFYEELSARQEEFDAETRSDRAGHLERRAVDRLREGKIYAARRALRHALSLRPSAQGHTLLACCGLLMGDAKEALIQARQAHALAPACVQTLCVLSDALYLAGEAQEGRKATALAALRAKDSEDLFAAATQSAKHDDDAMTLWLTAKLLHREPFHTRGMLLRACALTNTGRIKEASRLFGRLCGLLPEDTVCEYYYRLTCEGSKPDGRLTLGLEVPQEEAERRAIRLAQALGEEGRPENPQQERELCRLCAWAFHSSMTGEPVSNAALMVLGAMNTPAAQWTILDAMTDPQLPDSLKRAAMQTISLVNGVKPYDVDLDGRLLLVAAGGIANRSAVGENGSEPVQLACDMLMRRFPDAPRKLLPLWIAYLNAYGPVDGRHTIACAAALQALYHEQAGAPVELKRIARQNGVSPRLCRVYLRRIRAANASQKIEIGKTDQSPAGSTDKGINA